MAWVLQILGRVLSGEFTTGTRANREAFYRNVKERNQELLKPPQERDLGKLIHISKRDLLMRACLYRKEKYQLMCEIDDLKITPRPTSHLHCCPDCLRVRQRLLASCQSRAAWLRAWERLSCARLEALDRGELLPLADLPRFELRLPDGLPAELPPSVDRCSSCQQRLDEAIYKEQLQAAVEGIDPDWHLVCTPQQQQPWLQTPPAWLQPRPPQPEQQREQQQQPEPRQEQPQQQHVW